MNQENIARLRNMRDSLLNFAEELTFMLREEEGPPKEPEAKSEEEDTDWTTALGKTTTYLRDLKESTKLKGMDIYGQVENIMDLKTFTRPSDGSDGAVRNIVIKDETGSILVTFWDEQVNLVKDLNLGEYIRITNAWKVQKNKQGKLELHPGKFAKVEVVK